VKCRWRVESEEEISILIPIESGFFYSLIESIYDRMSLYIILTCTCDTVIS
jgi:hypothetical protein